MAKEKLECSFCGRKKPETQLLIAGIDAHIYIRQDKITLAQLEQMGELAGNYENLFSKRAQFYKERGLKNKTLTEEDYKALILEHYTFLSRPVFIIKNEIFIGNSQPNILKLMKTLENV